MFAWIDLAWCMLGDGVQGWIAADWVMGCMDRGGSRELQIGVGSDLSGGRGLIWAALLGAPCCGSGH